MADKFLDKEGLQIVADNTNLRVKIVTEVLSTPRNDMVILYNGADTADFKKGGIYKYNGTEWESFGDDVEQVYDATSEKAQSGKAVEQAVEEFIMNNTELYIEPYTWSGFDSVSGSNIWTDGDNIYYSNNSEQYVLNKATDTWEPKTWQGELTEFYASDYIWTDEDNIYYSDGSDQYVLNKSTSTWESKTWNRLTSFSGYCTWTDGTNIYYSEDSTQYVLNKSTSTWEEKTWYDIPEEMKGNRIWTDGDNIYYSNNSDQYVLNKSTSTWEPKTWQGLTDFYGFGIWKDGVNIYYSFSWYDQYVLNKATSTWERKTWQGLTDFYGYGIWKDGDNIYYSNNSEQYVLHRKFNTLIK